MYADVEYTYFDGGVHSADLGSDGDLVQVKTRRLKSGGDASHPEDFIVRYTQYRYYPDSTPPIPMAGPIN